MQSGISRDVAVGVFLDRSHAQCAIRDLRDAGFREDQIGVAARDGALASSSELDADTARGKAAATGAGAGVAVGAGAGALWALGIAAGMLPAIGPVIAGGLLAAVAASAAGGAAVAGLVGALVGLGIPEDEAARYDSEFKAGKTIVTVRTGDRSAEASSILRKHNGYDVHATAGAD